MAKKTAKSPLQKAWSDIARNEAGLIGAATRAVERVPSPADMVDSALLFAANTLKSQRKTLVPLLNGVTPTSRKGEQSRPADAVSAAYDLAISVVETQRKVLKGLVEAVTPPLARHAPKRRTTKAARPARRVPRKLAPARHTTKAAA